MGIKEWWSKLPTGSKKTKTVVTPAPAPKKKSPKELATEKGEPWVSVMSFDLDMDNLGSGSFDLDWNELFVARLVRAGYRGKDDVTIVEQWFEDVCRNVALEHFEQDMADPDKRARFNK